MGGMHLWPRHLNAPLYIPDQGRPTLKLLVAQGPQSFVEELERLSALGSAWASSALGYLCFLPRRDGTRDIDRVTKLCRPHADAGDPYASYVLAWVLLGSGEQTTAVKLMERAVKRGFAPAKLESVGWNWHLFGWKDRDPLGAIALLDRVTMDEHKASWIWRCEFYRSGKFGLARLVLGYLLTPIAYIRYLYALWRDPLSESVFVFRPNASMFPSRTGRDS